MITSYPAHWKPSLEQIRHASGRVQVTAAAAAKLRMRQMVEHTKLVRRGRYEQAQKLVDSPPARAYAAYAEAAADLERALGAFLGESREKGEEPSNFFARAMVMLASVEAIRETRRRNGLDA